MSLHLVDILGLLLCAYISSSLYLSIASSSSWSAAYESMLKVLGVASIAHAAVSFTLTKNPHLCRPTTCKKAPRFTASAHRGGGGDAPENTMEAFLMSVREGVDCLETDCHLTKDGHVVILHDAHLKRVTGLDKYVHETNLKEIPPLLGELEDINRPGWKLDASGFKDRHIPTLDELLEGCPDSIIHLDIKGFSPDLPKQAVEEIRRHGAQDRVILGSFNESTVSKLREFKDVARLHSMQRIVLMTIAYYTGFLPYLEIKESQFSIPMWSPDYKASRVAQKWPSWKIVIAEWLIRGMNNPGMLSHLKGRGVQTCMWVLNNEEDMTQALDFGADAVMSDHPRLMMDTIRKYFVRRA